ncbi:MAG: tRNA uridine-5-carboxymethylaminomethyl(34) synthesis GTPase MnmE [Deltaproteobacteria bacterium]|nr:tRNA uridine-5-carboxymethylaminomethyl(34) synthesis GTPase MnmE [Candidatus Zymogenaceae bacterium]
MNAADPFEETIVAVATPPGEGGIGIVRLSGPRAVAIGKRIFAFTEEPKRIEPYRLYTGVVTVSDDLPEGGQDPRKKADVPGAVKTERNDPTITDRALFVLMRAPRSYTGQDVVELHCHGSPLLLASVVTAAVSMGARPAKRGEFTQRAFMNGKIDLVQAEAVADLIAAKTTDGLSVFSCHLMGGLSERLSDLRERLVSLLADVEASVDFSDQDIDPQPVESIVGDIEASFAFVKELLGSYRVGRVYREGARLVIAGRPNVGKSSLMNRLLGRPRAIVAPEPGTTTDTIEDVMDIGGIPVRIVDTCGLREAVGAVEREGVQRTRQALDTADATLLVAEATIGLDHQERAVIEAAAAADRRVVLVINKVDLVASETSAPPDLAVPTVFTSALVGTGIDTLKDVIGSLIVGGASSGSGQDLITNARHYAALLSVSQFLEQAHEGAIKHVSPEFIALDIREALASLGEITGDVTTDEILEAIFSRFCVGK